MSSATESVKTALYEVHQELGAKLIDFHGWIMPVQFEGIIKEHEHVRNSVGVFDVSHMGEFYLIGEDAQSALQKIVANNVSRLEDGQCLYSPLCYDNGTMVDDLLVYRFNSKKYMIVVNASNIQKDFDWMSSKLSGDCKLTNHSDEISLLAVQGPKAQAALSSFFNKDLSTVATYRFTEIKYNNKDIIVSRTGYTGEDGFEIYLSDDDAITLYRELVAIDDVKPIGLGARDTLRFEAKLPLYGNELNDQVTPIETGLKRFCDMDGDDFIGKDVLAKQIEQKPSKKISGIEMLDRGIPRTGYPVFDAEVEGKQIGIVTSGSHCPTLEKTCALILMDRLGGKIGKQVWVEIRSKRKSAKIIKTPFYKREQ
ncbi:MAG: glycine cleavage system aminomethyltransferase GcvT [Candidatus Cloacimonetes bacterium]|nr:glycine cleavage system aminomethyltransferase GcvT [Candidatus Cloacimonadota bacterium]